MLTDYAEDASIAMCENAKLLADIILQNSRNHTSCTDRGEGMALHVMRVLASH